MSSAIDLACTCPLGVLVHSVHCPTYVEPRYTISVPLQSAPAVPLVSDRAESLPINAGNVQVLLNLLWPGNRFVVEQVEHDGEVAITYRNGRAPTVVHGRLGEPVLPLLLAVQKALRRHGSDLL